MIWTHLTDSYYGCSLSEPWAWEQGLLQSIYVRGNARCQDTKQIALSVMFVIKRMR